MLSNSKKSSTWKSILTRSSLNVGIKNHNPDRDFLKALAVSIWLEKLWRKGNFSKSLIGILFLLSNIEKIISISLSLLESGEPYSKFLFLFSKLRKRISDFSFSSRKRRLKK